MFIFCYKHYLSCWILLPVFPITDPYKTHARINTHVPPLGAQGRVLIRLVPAVVSPVADELIEDAPAIPTAEHGRDVDRCPVQDPRQVLHRARRPEGGVGPASGGSFSFFLSFFLVTTEKIMHSGVSFVFVFFKEREYVTIFIL